MTSLQPLPSDPWAPLRAYTPARIALGRTGCALPTQEVLALGLAHAQARDAVQRPLAVDQLVAELEHLGYPPWTVHSQAPDRATYLRRPDLGRQLTIESAALLDTQRSTAPMVIVMADGLSSLAIEEHAVPLLTALKQHSPARWSSLPVVVARQARVALGDAIGEHLGAAFVVVMIGERPGLSAPDSLGVYLTYAPQIGCSDAQRNCVSNVRSAGLSYAAAAARVDWLVAAGLSRRLTGVELKDESAAAHPPLLRD